jgi:hypothetical protein
MLTQAQVIEAVKSGRGSDTIDGRDYGRLASFFPVADWHMFGCSLKEGAEPPEPTAWTEDEVKKQLADDLAFAFEKALNKRGLSASMMYSVIKMWMWVFEDELQHMEEYAQYGLPFFKAVALKYGLPNEIGDDDGDEFEYSAEADR